MPRNDLPRTLSAAATALVTGLTGAALVGVAAPAAADRTNPEKVPTSTGYGGAVSSVDPVATRVGLKVLQQGGNAVDAAVATAAALGVTEPYSAGIGGGGYFVHYDASTGEVSTLDGRETAPAGADADSFVDPATGAPYPFTPERVTSGVSVGVPGTLATWEDALDAWGSWDLKRVLKPARQVASRGFVVDQTFRDQTADNAERFAAFDSTADLFLPGGEPPAVGSTFRNPDLADTYKLISKQGTDAFYGGQLGAEVAAAVQDPPTVPDTELPVPPGTMTTGDLASYETVFRDPTRVEYRGYDVYGMPPSSSGGSTVGEALQILERFDTEGMSEEQVLHLYLEASALAFADRNRYVGDPAFVDVPLGDLLSPTYAAERACEIDPQEAFTPPVPPGDVTDYDGRCEDGSVVGSDDEDNENIETTNLTVVDRWGDVVEYTLTIEQTGGSGITVPGRGFLLNNELTDFSSYCDGSTPATTAVEDGGEDPNCIMPGKRPRSSIAPTILLRDGEPVLALGTPGGSTIITTVLQMIVNYVDLGMTPQEMIAAPRASQRNTSQVTAEPEFVAEFGPELEGYGHVFRPAGDAFTGNPEIGAATAIEIGPDGRLTAVAEPVRRGGGSALVLRDRR